MNKKILWLALPVFLLIVAGAFLFIKKPGNTPLPAGDCKMTCENNKPIPCKTNDDCEATSMTNYCQQKIIVFKNGFSGYCKEGYCQAYGCGGAPAID